MHVRETLVSIPTPTCILDSCGYWYQNLRAKLAHEQYCYTFYCLTKSHGYRESVLCKQLAPCSSEGFRWPKTMFLFNLAVECNVR